MPPQPIQAKPRPAPLQASKAEPSRLPRPGSIASSASIASHQPREKPLPACHPFLCRLTRDAAFESRSAYGLKSAGYASLVMGIFTIFRLTPMLFFMLLVNLKADTDDLKEFRTTAYAIAIPWMVFILLILFALGSVLLATPKLKIRPVLLLHPWFLIALYFDVLVWLYLTIAFQTKVCKNYSCEDSKFQNVYNGVVYFVFMYIDITMFFCAHWMFATYFIVAELTVIEFHF